MALKEVMNALGTIGHKSGSLISGGVFVITSTPSAKVLAPSTGPGVHLDPLKYTFSGGNAAGFEDGSVATVTPQEIESSALKVEGESKKVMLKGDFGTMNAVGIFDPPASPTTGPVTGPVEIKTPGQVKFLSQ